MPRTEPADVLAFSNVQGAIGNLIRDAARETGIADKYGDKMARAIVDKIAEGSPIGSAIALVAAIQEATINVSN